MEIGEIIEIYQQSVVQIATPYSTGTGFYIPKYELFVTNEHVIRDNKEVVVVGDSIAKQLASVVYLDQDFDLALLKVNNPLKVNDKVVLSNKDVLSLGEEVVSLGHPFGMKFSVTKGIISTLEHKITNTQYLQHDAALHPGNSGGPLVNMQGEIIGINTFVSRDGRNLGFALPVKKLEQVLDEFSNNTGEKAIKCNSCKKMVFEVFSDSYCGHCGANIKTIDSIQEYEPHGVNKTIEQMIENMGYNVKLSLTGPSSWALAKGSAMINITYHEKSGLITGDAHLCQLPDDHILNIYQYLLEENYKLEGLTFSVKDSDIILSLLIFDQYFNMNTASELFGNLFSLSDYYDNILVEKFGGQWNSEI